MNVKKLFGQRLIVSNSTITKNTPADTVAKAKENIDIEGYNYERIFNEGVLEALLHNPQQAMPSSIRFHKQANGGRFDGTWIRKGIDFIIPLLALKYELAARLNQPIEKPNIIFNMGISGEVAVRISGDEWELFIKDVEAIYAVNIDLTYGYFKRHLASMSDDDCKKLNEKVDSLEIIATID